MSSTPGVSIAICAKSAWFPAIRREHALAVIAAQRGMHTHFIEAPSDIRMVMTNPRWAIARPTSAVEQGVLVHARRTLVPGHRGGVARRIDSAGLSRLLSSMAQDLHAVVVNTPWHWRAVRSLGSHVRLVADLADDWRSLIPQRAEMIEQWYREIDSGADEVIVVNPDLQQSFSRPVSVVPNGVSRSVLDAAAAATRRPRHMVYVGTLSERFDTELVAMTLESLPEWTLSLYGPKHFSSKAAASRLEDLLRKYQERIRYCGVVAREGLPSAIDEADVAVIPNRRAFSAGQDSMKLYDYAARARPIVAAGLPTEIDAPSSATLTKSPVEFVAAVAAHAGVGAAAGPDWCASRTWSHRADSWLKAVLGTKSETPPFRPEGVERLP